MYEHISLGPTCFAAYVLKISGLRSASFPFDWARSGSSHVEDIFQLAPEEFYFSHIHTPCQQLLQLAKPSPGNNFTAPLGPRQALWGFPYFYNPHRPIGRSRDYFMRCLKRFHEAIHSQSKIPSFLLADHIGKPGHNFLEEPHKIARYLTEILDTNLDISYKLTILRTEERSDGLSKCRLDSFGSAKHTANIISVKVARQIIETYASDKDYLSLLLGKIYIKSLTGQGGHGGKDN